MDPGHSESRRGSFYDSLGRETFSFVRTVARNLAWNDQTLFVTRRTGDLRTSGKEVLLSQQVYLSSKRSVLENVKGKQIWPANQFGPEEDQRKIEDGYNLDLLELSEDGNTLSGKTGTFYRGNPSGFGYTLSLHDALPI